MGDGHPTAARASVLGASIPGEARWAAAGATLWLGLAGVCVWLAGAIALLAAPSGSTAARVLLAATYGCAIAVAVTAAARKRSAPWMLAALAVAGYSFTALAHTLAAGATSDAPNSFLAGLFVFYPSLLAALLIFTRTYIRVSAPMLWIDCAALACALAAAALLLAMPGIDLRPRPSEVGALLYLCGDVVLLATVGALSCLTDGSWARRLMVLAGLGALMSGDLVFVTGSAPGTVPQLSIVLWPLAMLALAVGLAIPAGRLIERSRGLRVMAIPIIAALTATVATSFAGSGQLSDWLATSALLLVVVRLGWNVVEKARLVERLSRVALIDPLTGVASRKLLLDQLDAALGRLGRDRRLLAVMLVDLDDFKFVNDSLGHACGDAVLQEIAGRLRVSLRGSDAIGRTAPTETVARLGGDEFAIVVEDLGGEAEAATVADRLLESLTAPMLVAEQPLAIEATIGIVLTNRREDVSSHQLLRRADAAMGAAKEAGKRSYRFFETTMQERLEERVGLTRDLRQAVSAGQLRLLYQPQVDLMTGRLLGVEALVRWEHPERGLLAPASFIPHAEATGAIVEIDTWVLHRACRQLADWQRADLDIRVAVNVSGARISAPGFVEELERAVMETGVDPRQLEIEVTETLAGAANHHVAGTLAAIRRLGAHTAIDDFGTGYSALSRLQEFPIDRLKVDRSFITGLDPSGSRGRSLVAAMIAMAATLELSVVAEGVETIDQLRALQALGCPSGQGYLFSRPVSPAQIERLAHVSLPLGRLRAARYPPGA